MNQESLEAFVERESLQYIGLEFLPREDGTAPAPTEVLEYLRARGIVAGVADGARFASPLPVVANLAVLPDDSIAISASAESFGHGQNAEAFLPGLAYSLNSKIVMNEEVVFLPNGDVEDHDPEDIPAGLDRSIHLCGSDDPTPAYLSLLEVESAGSYGYVDGKLFFSPPQGYLATSSVTTLNTQSRPMMTFTRAGESLWATIALTDSGDNDVVVRCGPGYDSTLPPSTTPVPESPLAYLEAWVVNMPSYSTSELFDSLSAPDVSEKMLRKFPEEDLKRAQNLRRDAEALSALPREDFLVAATQSLGLSTEETGVVSDFEKAPIDQVFGVLGGQKMTRVEPFGQTSILRSTSQGVSISATHAVLKKDVSRNPRSLRVRAHRSEFVQQLPAIFSAVMTVVIGTGLIGSLFNERWAKFLDLSGTGDWVYAWVIFGIFLVGSVLMLAQRPSLNRARSLLRTARKDGVYPYDI